VVKEHEAGMPTADVCHDHSVSSATFCKYKVEFGDTEVSEAPRLRVLEDENARLKNDLAADVQVLSDEQLVDG
jgi:putative transposase